MNFLDAAILGRPGSFLGIRPEHIGVDPSDGDVTGWVEHVETLGSETNVFVRTDHLGIVTVRLFGHRDLAPGDALSLRFDRRRELYFDKDGKRIR